MQILSCTAEKFFKVPAPGSLPGAYPGKNKNKKILKKIIKKVDNVLITCYNIIEQKKYKGGIKNDSKKS